MRGHIYSREGQPRKKLGKFLECNGQQGAQGAAGRQVWEEAEEVSRSKDQLGGPITWEGDHSGNSGATSRVLACDSAGPMAPQTECQFLRCIPRPCLHTAGAQAVLKEWGQGCLLASRRSPHPQQAHGGGQLGQRKPWILGSPSLSLLSSWDYRCVPWCAQIICNIW
jgi:hypothetical protein